LNGPARLVAVDSDFYFAKKHKQNEITLHAYQMRYAREAW